MAQLAKGHGLGMVAAGPNAIDLSGGDGYRPRVGKRIFLTDRAEYLLPVGNQTLKVQTPHCVSFSRGGKCTVRLAVLVWYRYPADGEAAEKERVRRQLV